MNLSAEQTLNQQEERLNKYLRYSLIVHVVLFLVLTVENVFFANLTAVTDNAALTYLGAQVESLPQASRYFLVTGVVEV